MVVELGRLARVGGVGIANGADAADAEAGDERSCKLDDLLGSDVLECAEDGQRKDAGARSAERRESIGR